MTALQTLLAFYYLCDQAAAQQVLNRGDVDACMANYNELKLTFIDEMPAPIGGHERAAQNRLGYVGFKAWEQANPDLVAEYRARALLVLAYSQRPGRTAIAGLTSPLGAD